jgi:exocyst complex component 4
MAISGRNPIASINEVLRSASQVREKIKVRRIQAQAAAVINTSWKASFRFGDTDAKISARLLRKQDDELSKVLKETVPGLVTTGPADGAPVTPLSTVVSLDDRSSAGLGHHHRLLITPDALHVTVLFQPTLAWLDSVNAAFPASLAVPITEAQSLLDDFVLNIYLPQLEEKVQTLFQNIVSAPDAFHEDPGWKNLSTVPLIKVIWHVTQGDRLLNVTAFQAITNLVALINSMCAMMRVTPFHHENYSRLILGIIMQFYQRCSDRFQSLTTRTPTMPGVVADPSQFLTPAAWAQRSDLVKCFVSLLSSSVSLLVLENM